MRLVILSRMFDRLKAIYNMEWPRKVFRSGKITRSEMDALLAYKSDAQLDELYLALDRVERIDYGACMVCHGEIEQPLLDEDPSRRFCARCERSLEYKSPVLKEAEQS